MLKKTIKYTDYNGVERTEDFYFNLSRAELTEMELEVPGGLTAMLKKISETKDVPSLIKHFKDLILRSYGEKSADGKRFIKSKELTEAFTQTEAFTELYMELVSSADAAADFVNGIVPESVAKEAAKLSAKELESK